MFWLFCTLSFDEIEFNVKTIVEAVGVARDKQDSMGIPRITQIWVHPPRCKLLINYTSLSLITALLEDGPATRFLVSV